MTSAILHVGFGKCGSSALQTALSASPSLLDSKGRPVEYVALRPEGVLRRSDLAKAARRSAFGYESSVAARALADCSDEDLASKAQVLAELAGDDEGRVIISNEGWINQRSMFDETGLLPALGLECEVVVYARPPVEWINSAWWQWGAWTGATFGHWLNGTLGKVKWADLVEPWRNVPGIKKVTVRLLPRDVVSDFCGLAGVSPPTGVGANASLPGSVLRLYQRHSELRPGPHSSAIDFILARNLWQSEGKTPWVIGPETVEQIIEATQNSNTALLDYLEPDSREIMRCDPRWWDAEAYRGYDAEPPGGQPADAESVDALAAEALQRIFELDKDNRRLRNQLENADKKQSASAGQ